MKKNIVLFVFMSAVSAAEGFLNRNNGYLQLMFALLSSVIVFYMPQLIFKLKKLPGILLFCANTAIMALTYVLLDQRILLVNMLLMSYIIWTVITPGLLRFKSLLPVAFMISFISVYGASLLQFSIPLFILVFYPVYVLGCIVKSHNVIYNKKIYLFGLFNLLFSGLLLLVFMFKSLGLTINESMLFLKIEKLGTTTALYLPFIALFLIWFLATVNFLVYMPFSKFIKGRNSFELTSYMKPFVNFILFFAVSSVVVFICEFSIRQDLDDTVRNFLDPNILFNILIVASIYLCLISILGKGISNILLAILSIFLVAANCIKITYFNEPFYPWDLYLVRNMIGISKEYINMPVIIAVLLAIVLGIFLLIRNRKSVLRHLKPKISFILIPFGIVLVLISGIILTTYSLSSQIGVIKSWYIGKNEILANGVFAQNYFYLSDLDKYLNPKPENYSKEAMLAIAERYHISEDTQTAQAKEDVKPNVVMIMSESFWDITKLNGISYSKDIMENVHKYQKGQIAPPVIGGGTANTEFEALTGMSMYFIGPGIITYNAFLRTTTPSLASVFKDNGYQTIAIHPNNGWFYNRDKVYKYFGFDRFIELSGFDQKTQFKGSHISDEAFINKVIDTLETAESPTFIFGLSIENHDPYQDKYRNLEVSANSDRLSETENNIVTNFSQGIYDADQTLGKLINKISESKKPTLVYFFGDHAPRLGSLNDYYTIYDRLGSNDNSAQNQGIDQLKYYTTPFATYSNYREMPDMKQITSPANIAYQVLIDSGVKYPSYFNILAKLEEVYPVVHPLLKDQIDGNTQLIKDYNLIQYDLLFGKKYLSQQN